MIETPTFAIILPAAGSGTRFGGGDKLLMDIAGQSVLQRSVSLFSRRPNVSLIVIVTAPDRIEIYRKHLSLFTIHHSPLSFIAGGRERWESVLMGLRFAAGAKSAPAFVAVHDAARPLTPAAVIDEAFRVSQEKGAALPCVPEPATLKRAAADGSVLETVDRRGLFQAQTPQCFALAPLLAGYEKLLATSDLNNITDDAQIFERMGEAAAGGRGTGKKVPITPGDPLNIKITTHGDLALARAIIAATEPVA
jgi:2-C-methyl-D-erythritol 4-phosphate cytidylyltransferase